MVRGRMNDTDFWVQLEFKGLEAIGQSLPDGFQGRFLQASELEESPKALRALRPINSIRLGSRKKPMSEFYSLQVPRLIFQVDADPMGRRPCPEKAEPAGRKTKPEFR
jgi:hypothetical protein